LHLRILLNFNRYYYILFPGTTDLATLEGRAADRYCHAAWTTIATVVARVIALIAGLISVPLTIHYLGGERFGLWMTITAAVSMLQFADLGIGNGLLNKIAEAIGRDDRESIRLLINTGMAVLGLIGIFLIGLFAMVNTFISWPTIFNATSADAISEAGSTTAVLIVIFALNIMLSPIVRINMGLQRGYINGIWQIIGSIIGLLALIIALQLKVGLPILVASYMSGPVLATVANGFLLFLHTHPWAKPSLGTIDLSIARSLIVLGFWFLLFQIVVSVNNAIPNLVISHVLSLNQVAIFAVALKLASIAVILQSAILMPLWPAYAEARTCGDWAWIKRTLIRSLVLSGAIGLVGSTLMVVFGPTIIRIWIGADTIPPRGVLWGLGVWVLSSSLYGPLTMFLNGMGRIRIQAIYGIIFSIFMLCTCIVLVKLFNLSGVAWAYGVTYTLPSIAVSSFIVYNYFYVKK